MKENEKETRLVMMKMKTLLPLWMGKKEHEDFERRDADYLNLKEERRRLTASHHHRNLPAQKPGKRREREREISAALDSVWPSQNGDVDP